MTEDLSPYSQKKIKEIKEICEKNGINFIYAERDYILIDNVLQKPYYKFSYFEKYMEMNKQNIRTSNKKKKYDKRKTMMTEYKINIYEYYKKMRKNENAVLMGGRTNALKKIKKLRELNEYHENKYSLIYDT